MQSVLLLLSLLFARSYSLMCSQCGGERYSGELRLLRATCCEATVVECAAGSVCLRAVVVSPHKSFILSGCHVPEDGLIGCDFHKLPYNATIHRCVCVDQSCQKFFPTGKCSTSTVHEVKTRPILHHRKSYPLSSRRTTTLQTTTTTLARTSTASEPISQKLHHTQRREQMHNSASVPMPCSPYPSFPQTWPPLQTSGGQLCGQLPAMWQIEVCSGAMSAEVKGIYRLTVWRY